MNDEERQLWRIGDFSCVMISCCSGAELQLRRADEIVLREMYPMKSDLYDRARALRVEHEPGSEKTGETAESARKDGSLRS